MARKGFIETAAILAIVSLLAGVTTMSVSVNGFMNVLGLQADSNDAQMIEEELAALAREVCREGAGAEAEGSFSPTSKLNVTLQSEGDASRNLPNDPENDQVITATKYDSATLIWEDTNVIPDCQLRFRGDRYLNFTRYVFEADQDYSIEIDNQGGSGDPEVYIDVSTS